jgi:hypothetical protein
MEDPRLALRAEREENLLVLGSIVQWVERLPKELGEAIKSGQDLAKEADHA